MDVYGPSLPIMLGTDARPQATPAKRIVPLERYGIRLMSMGFFLDEQSPVIWRGPIVMGIVRQFLRDVEWGELDELVVDLPPGTGDAPLTLVQQVPLTGAVIVTTPQDIALIDARKGLKMFEKVGIPIIGVVENMAIHICSNCGHAEHIFGSGGAEKMSKDYDVEVLGSLPLDIRIREQADSGKPTVVADPDGPVAAIYRDIARKVAARIARQSEDRSAVFPKIVIQNN
jgi:ATP-binding protein involved in chromosome partitioning